MKTLQGIVGVPVKYHLPVRCCFPKCSRADMIHILATKWYTRISMPKGWKRHEPSGYCLCPEHIEYEVTYFDDDSVLVQTTTHNE